MSVGIAAYDPPPVLRSEDKARRCKFLGANLTEEEVKQYTAQLLAGGIPCRQCDGKIPGHHCSHQTAGPFTRVAGKCTSCRYFATAPSPPVAEVAVVPPAIEGEAVVGEQV